MKIRIYWASAKYNWERDILRAWYEGIINFYGGRNPDETETKTLKRLSREHDIDIDFEYHQRVQTADLSIMYGGWRNKGDVHKFRTEIVEKSPVFICNETPIVGRSTKSKGHWWNRVGVNGFLNGEGTFYSEEQLNPNRWKLMQEVFKIKRKPWRDKGDHIILALQLPGDSSMKTQDLSDWAIDAVEEIRKYSSRKIIVRLHPLLSDDGFMESLPFLKKVIFNDWENVELGKHKVPFEDDLVNAHCVVAYSSGLSIDSIINGIPVIAVDRHNFAYEISSHLISDIENPKLIEDHVVDDWLNRLSNSQWNRDEITNGTTWKHLLTIIEEKINENQINMDIEDV